MSDRLEEIKKAWNLNDSLPREAPEGLDDVVWLVGEIERLRREASFSAERLSHAEEFREYWRLRCSALEEQSRDTEK